MSNPIEYEGCMPIRNWSFYTVFGVKMTIKDGVYHCTCKFHSVKDVHNLKSCRYKRILKKYLEKK